MAELGMTISCFSFQHMEKANSIWHDAGVFCRDLDDLDDVHFGVHEEML